MNARIPSRSDLFESVARSLLGLALIAGVVWALTQGGAMPGVDIGGVLR